MRCLRKHLCKAEIMSRNVDIVSQENLKEAAGVHAAAWRESHRSVCSVEFIREHTTQRQMEYIRCAINQGKRFFVLTDDVPVAVVSVDGSIIADLYVHPDYQRRGYGTCLLEYAMTQCNGNPSWWVMNINRDARRLYERCGFVPSGQTKKLKDGLFEIEMKYKKG